MSFASAAVQNMGASPFTGMTCLCGLPMVHKTTYSGNRPYWSCPSYNKQAGTGCKGGFAWADDQNSIAELQAKVQAAQSVVHAQPPQPTFQQPPQKKQKTMEQPPVQVVQSVDSQKVEEISAIVVGLRHDLDKLRDIVEGQRKDIKEMAEQIVELSKTGKE